jgi:hypothetical protein
VSLVFDKIGDLIFSQFFKKDMVGFLDLTCIHPTVLHLLIVKLIPQHKIPLPHNSQIEQARPLIIAILNGETEKRWFSFALGVPSQTTRLVMLNDLVLTDFGSLLSDDNVFTVLVEYDEHVSHFEYVQEGAAVSHLLFMSVDA